MKMVSTVQHIVQYIHNMTNPLPIPHSLFVCCLRATYTTAYPILSCSTNRCWMSLLVFRTIEEDGFPPLHLFFSHSPNFALSSDIPLPLSPDDAAGTTSLLAASTNGRLMPEHIPKSPNPKSHFALPSKLCVWLRRSRRPCRRRLPPPILVLILIIIIIIL
ncbi:hypothetical protein F4809DRAFT_465947 [Biscogniauxia mediterranea]|nr:hypothetical protein F4809DRAFT_465947 [Biscogniauxia mediterranea]